MITSGSSGRDQGENGFAMFAVLSFLLLAATIVTPLVTNARSSALIARNVASDVKNSMLADALIFLASAEISKRSRIPDFSLPKAIKCEFESGQVEFEILNHAGLIDLNAASADLLRVGFMASGYAADVSEMLVQTALLYRSVGQPTGPVSPILVEGGLKGGLFESVDELNDFRAGNSGPAPDYRRVFTTRTSTGTILNSTIPPATELVLKNMPAQDAYFVVSGSPPIVALTLAITVTKQRKRSFGASVEIGPNASAEFRILSPIRVHDKQSGSETALVQRETSSCEILFDPGAIKAMRVLIDGEARQ